MGNFALMFMAKGIIDWIRCIFTLPQNFVNYSL